MVVKDQQYWLHKLATLRIDRASGNSAPHKPLLLLVILEMADKKEITNLELSFSPDLAFRFSVFWSVVAHRRKQPPEIRLPLHHIGSSGIWQPLTVDGKPSPDKKLTSMIRFDPSFFDFLTDYRFRDCAKRILIETDQYFQTDEKTVLYTMLKIKPIATGAQENKEILKTNIQIGRNARFRLEVVLAYKYTCALTGYRMTTLEMGSIVDAAHIHEFHDSRNNDPCNGMALSKNAHWQFDHGLWSLDNDYRVILQKDKFIEEGKLGQRLIDFEGQKIVLPTDSVYWPKKVYLDWHRKRHGFQND